MKCASQNASQKNIKKSRHTATSRFREPTTAATGSFHSYYISHCCKTQVGCGLIQFVLLPKRHILTSCIFIPMRVEIFPFAVIFLRSHVITPERHFLYRAGCPITAVRQAQSTPLYSLATGSFSCPNHSIDRFQNQGDNAVSSVQITPTPADPAQCCAAAAYYAQSKP